MTPIQMLKKTGLKTSAFWSLNPYHTLTLTMLILHGVYGAAVLNSHPIGIENALNHWDSGWYSQIIQEGYHGPNYAFYPLYPLAISIFQTLTFHLIPPPILGSLFSVLMLFTATGLVRKIAEEQKAQTLTFSDPVTPLGWSLVVFTPASYVFHTHHTEALFLWLSLGSFYLMCRNRWILASIGAGLCALTKNQGIFVAITLGVWAALNLQFPITRRGWLKCATLRFAASGFISGTIFGLYPLFCYFRSGDPMNFYAVQLHWRPEMSDGSYFRSLWFGNPWQNTNHGSILRYCLFWLLIATSLRLLYRRNISGLYCLLFVGIMPLSGEFVGTFRYSAVLFPIWFGIAATIGKLKGPWLNLTTALVFFVILYLNFDLWRSFLLHRWSY